ncbi:MAG: PilZ domain-containing protein [Candidatus Sericytochromatia bacterium]|nr:PilZ domain-containing protein [Candidatus Sericytochromatia bacterium]
MTEAGARLEAGQPVHVQWGPLLLKGQVRAILGNQVTLALPVPVDMPDVLVITWPDGQTGIVEAPLVLARQRLEVRIPLPDIGLADRLPGPAPEATREQRGALRLDAMVPAILRLDRGVARGHTLNVSSGGMLVHSPIALPVGKDVTVNLELRDGALEERIRILRKVGHQTFAVRFLGEPSSGPGRMRRIMNHMRPQKHGSRQSWNLRRP